MYQKLYGTRYQIDEGGDRAVINGGWMKFQKPQGTNQEAEHAF